MCRLPVGERRLVKRAGPRGLQRTGRSATRWQEPFVPKAGHIYSIQPGVGKPTAIHVKALAVRQERVGAITHDDAKREGHRNTAAFKVAWVARYGWRKEWDEDTPADEELLAIFERRHAGTLVHVVTFQPAETPMLLADVRKGRGDYTRSPGQTMDRGAECVDIGTQDAYAKAVRERDEQQRTTKLQTFEEDLRDARRRSQWGQARTERGKAWRNAA